ncbi:MAG: hypothetical protein VX642_10300, partial [Bdellovibrionota bacterium]|nr:hypothetical protein [Bdellovibrionota bacterium]
MMKLLLNFVLVFSLTVPSPFLFAKTKSSQGIKRSKASKASKTRYHKLSDYVLNIDQIRSLNYTDRLAYFYFMARSMEMVEFSLKRHHRLNAHLPQRKKEIEDLQAKFNLIQSIEDLILPKANALLPLIYLGIAGIVGGIGIEAATNENAEAGDYAEAALTGVMTTTPLRFLNVVKPLKKAFDKVSAMFKKSQKTDNLQINGPNGNVYTVKPTNVKVGEPTTSGTGVVPTGSSPGTSVLAPSSGSTTLAIPRAGNNAVLLTGAGVVAAGAAADAINANGNEETTNPNPPSDLENNGENVSQGLSTYSIGEQAANFVLNQTKPSPLNTNETKSSPKLKTGTCIIANHVSEYQEVAGANLCKQDMVKKCPDGSIKCGTFGLQLQNKVCEPKNPINSLTKRCAENLGRTLINEGIGYIDAQKYKEWEARVRAALEEFENSSVGNSNKSFNEYCANLEDEEAEKTFPQAVECNAVKTTINSLRKAFPAIAQEVQRKENEVKALAEKEARIKAERDFMAQKSSCQDPTKKAPADIASLERCTACGLQEQLGLEVSPSPTYLEMIRLLAVQCGGKEGQSLEDTANDKALVRHRMAQMISSVGFCQNFPTKNRTAQMGLLKNHYRDLVAGKSSLDDKEISKLFEKAYGIDSEDAQKAFCGKGLPKAEFEWGDSFKMQKTFNRRMYKNRTSENGNTRSNRERSG